MMRRQRGFSLIELLISMVIGLVVIGAMMAAYLGSGVGSRNSRALAQITEDASVALSVLRTTIGMAGYGAPIDIDGAGQFLPTYRGATLFGCDTAFTDPAQPIGALACGGDAGADAIAVAYEADTTNSVTNGAGEPLDCLGDRYDQAGGVWVAYQRFFVANGSLFCQGPGANAGQALVDNIQTIQFRYGVADAKLNKPNQVVRYEDASTMDAADFQNAVSVRVCVLVRSADEVMDPSDTYTYLDCNGDTQAPADRRMYRAFTSTIVLQNRIEAIR